jgi:hypothetical protein
MMSRRRFLLTGLDAPIIDFVTTLEQIGLIASGTNEDGTPSLVPRSDFSYHGRPQAIVEIVPAKQSPETCCEWFLPDRTETAAMISA